MGYRKKRWFKDGPPSDQLDRSDGGQVECSKEQSNNQTITNSSDPPLQQTGDEYIVLVLRSRVAAL